VRFVTADAKTQERKGKRRGRKYEGPRYFLFPSRRGEGKNPQKKKKKKKSSTGAQTPALERRNTVEGEREGAHTEGGKSHVGDAYNRRRILSSLDKLEKREKKAKKEPPVLVVSSTAKEQRGKERKIKGKRGRRCAKCFPARQAEC